MKWAFPKGAAIEALDGPYQETQAFLAKFERQTRGLGPISPTVYGKFLETKKDIETLCKQMGLDIPSEVFSHVTQGTIEAEHRWL